MSADLRRRIAQLERAVTELQEQLLEDASVPVAPPAVHTASKRVKVSDVITDADTVEALAANGINYVDELDRKTDEQLLALHDIGKVRVKRIRESLGG